MGNDKSDPSNPSTDGSPPDQTTTDEQLDPSGIAQFVEHDRCPRYLKQRVDPGEESEARDWREAFGLMNIALLGKGTEFEADQLEALAADATQIVAPELDDKTKSGVPDISVDQTWVESQSGRTAQLKTAIEQAATLNTADEDSPYTLLYQVPLSGTLGEEHVYGDADCIALKPTDAVPTADSDADTNPAVVARVIDCKSATDEQPAHRVQVAAYCALLEQTLAEGPCEIDCRIEASVLTNHQATDSGQTQSPFELPTFRRAEWQLFLTNLLKADGPIEEALTDDLQELPFALDQVCNNCAYREACATRAVENSRESQSLAMLGLNVSTQRSLQEAGLRSLHDVATLCAPQRETTPMDDPPQLTLDADLKRSLEEILPTSIHELILRAQALYSEIEPRYPDFQSPPAIPGNDWVPLPDDRCEGWSNIDSADPGELIHVSLFVRPDSAINRIGVLGACITADAADESITIAEVIEAVPDDETLASTVEADLFERFLTELFDAIEDVATTLCDPEQAVVHCYTFSEHELDALIEALDRHSDRLPHARALRGLCSLDEDGHTSVDQSMITAVQPVVNEYFALQSPSQGLLSVVEQFDSTWNADTLDPQTNRPTEPPLREIFGEQFLDDAVPYLEDDTGIRLHQARGQLAGGPAVDAVNTADPNPDPDGWYRIRKRSGGQFPLEYLWAAVPKHPGDDTPRLHPAIVEEWAIDDEHKPLYRQEINRFYYRTDDHSAPLQREDVEYLAERLSDALMGLIDAVPYKDAYQSKTPLDATNLGEFDLPVTRLPAAARDYLRMEFGATQERIREQYRQSLRDRARSSRSIPIRCTDIDQQSDGSLTIRAELAYDALFEDTATATQVAKQARLRSSDGPGGGSWRVITRTNCPTDTTTGPSASGLADIDCTVDDPAAIKHSPPILVEDITTRTGTIELAVFGHRFQQHGSRFRVDHCGWDSPVGSNLSEPNISPTERSGYVAGREPVWIDTGELYMLDPMVDDFGAPKADRALLPDTVKNNQLYQHLQSIRQTGHQQPVVVADPDAIEAFLDTIADAQRCLDPNPQQRAFIRAVDRTLVPLQGPPGTGKTSGATAPALLARAFARAQHGRSFVGIVVAPSHEAVDAVLDGVVNLLANWRTETDGLSNLRLIRALPASPPDTDTRVDATTAAVDVQYANYHSTAGEQILQELATEVIDSDTTAPAADAEQCLLFATPATLYRTLEIVAETVSAIDGDSAPAAMRHAKGLADVVCVDEASMLDLPQFLLAGSVLKPAGQTLLVGDHRQLATVTETEWSETRRKPLLDTNAYYSAIEHIQELAATTVTHSTATDGGRQSVLDRFLADSEPTEGNQ